MTVRVNIGGKMFELLWREVGGGFDSQEIGLTDPGVDFVNGCAHNIRDGYYCRPCELLALEVRE
jgi:hypothetical protein